MNIITIIVNHNNNDNAINLKNIFSKFGNCFLIDSGSNIILDEFDYTLENVGYSGLFNRSVELFFEKGGDILNFICSDVIINKKEAEKLINTLTNLTEDDNIGVYSPSSSGQSHKHCKNYNSNSLRDVVFVEGFMFAAKKEILEEIYPVDTKINSLGHGLDAYKGFLCLKKHMRCVIDDNVKVFHPPGTGYNTNLASIQFINWMKQASMKDFMKFWYDYSEKNFADSEKTLMEYNYNKKMN